MHRLEGLDWERNLNDEKQRGKWEETGRLTTQLHANHWQLRGQMSLSCYILSGTVATGDITTQDWWKEKQEACWISERDWEMVGSSHLEENDNILCKK